MYMYIYTHIHICILRHISVSIRYILRHILVVQWLAEPLKLLCPAARKLSTSSLRTTLVVAMQNESAIKSAI